jgi:hypothetical protein
LEEALLERWMGFFWGGLLPLAELLLPLEEALLERWAVFGFSLLPEEELLEL